MNALPTFLVFACCFSGSSVAKILRTNCRKEGTFTNILVDRFLENHVIQTLITTSALECAFHCVPDQRCLSYNYAPGLQKCELNNETAVTKPLSLKSKPGTFYYDTGTSSYCQNGGTPQGVCLRHHQVLCLCTSRWTGDDCSIPKLGGAISTAGESCRSIKNAGDSVGDALYWMKPAGAPSAFNVTCSMSKLGVWTRVTAAMLNSVTKAGVTISTGNVGGGLQVSGTVTNNGCGSGTGSASIIYINGYWTKIKYKQEFRGLLSCWRVFGSTKYSNHGGSVGQINHGLIQFSNSQDSISGQYYMNGLSGHVFSGVTTRCDNNGDNFWDAPVSGGLRYATVTLRRNATIPLAGILTATSCGLPTYVIKEIYVYD